MLNITHQQAFRVAFDFYEYTQKHKHEVNIVEHVKLLKTGGYNWLLDCLLDAVLKHNSKNFEMQNEEYRESLIKEKIKERFNDE